MLDKTFEFVYGKCNYLVRTLFAWYRMYEKLLVFMDVDLYDLMISYIKNLWHSPQKGYKFFTHEAHQILTVKAFSDKRFWEQELRAFSPKFICAGKGLNITKSCLGYV